MSEDRQRQAVASAVGPRLFDAMGSIEAIVEFVRSRALPAIEATMSGHEYTELELHLQVVEKALVGADLVASASRRKIAAMTPDELGAFMRETEP